MTREPLLIRFIKKLAPHPEGCWIWTGSRQPHNGYGRIGAGSRAAGVEVAHRVSWRLFRGAIPDGLNVLHRCDRPACVNPMHLFLGTQAENLADMRMKGRHAHGRRVPQAKLSPADIPAIREAARAGVAQEEIGRRFGISGAAIRHILHGRTWKHIHGGSHE